MSVHENSLGLDISDEAYEKHKRYRRDWHKNNRKLVLFHYSNGEMKCACCGENKDEFLSIDDIEGTIHRKIKKQGVRDFYRWLMRNNYPKGFQVLCMNCNFAKGMSGKCPHQLDKKVEVLS